MKKDSLHPLIEGWLENDLGATEEKELNAWLKEDQANMAQLVEAAQFDQSLREAMLILEGSSTLHRPVSRMKLRQRLIPTARFAAAAAVILALGFLGFASFKRMLSVTGAGAEVVSTENLRMNGGSLHPIQGETILLDHFHIEEGSLEVLLDSGVRIVISAPAHGTFYNDMLLSLDEGRISADVGESGKGFTVETPAGKIVDLGTRFGVEAEAQGESRVAVFSGSVEFHPNEKGKKGNFITLTEGEALRFSARAGLRRWESIALEAERAGLSSAPNSGVVREVHDNLGNDDLRPFYGVISQGMKPGALAFIDKPNPVWQAYPGESFPEWLENADLVRTYYRFSHKRGFELTLTLSQPAEIYVLHVTPAPVPEWLKEGFEPTGVKLLAGPWNHILARHPGALDKADGPHLTFSIWKTEADAGEFRLGPPTEIDDPSVPLLMYGLAVKTKNESPE